MRLQAEEKKKQNREKKEEKEKRKRKQGESLNAFKINKRTVLRKNICMKMTNI